MVFFDPSESSDSSDEEPVVLAGGKGSPHVSTPRGHALNQPNASNTSRTAENESGNDSDDSFESVALSELANELESERDEDADDFPPGSQAHRSEQTPLAHDDNPTFDETPKNDLGNRASKKKTASTDYAAQNGHLNEFQGSEDRDGNRLASTRSKKPGGSSSSTTKSPNPKPVIKGGARAETLGGVARTGERKARATEPPAAYAVSSQDAVESDSEADHEPRPEPSQAKRGRSLAAALHNDGKVSSEATNPPSGRSKPRPSTPSTPAVRTRARAVAQNQSESTAVDLSAAQTQPTSSPIKSSVARRTRLQDRVAKEAGKDPVARPLALSSAARQRRGSASSGQNNKSAVTGSAAVRETDDTTDNAAAFVMQDSTTPAVGESSSAADSGPQTPVARKRGRQKRSVLTPRKGSTPAAIDPTSDAGTKATATDEPSAGPSGQPMDTTVEDDEELAENELLAISAGGTETSALGRSPVPPLPDSNRQNQDQVMGARNGTKELVTGNAGLSVAAEKRLAPQHTRAGRIGNAADPASVAVAASAGGEGVTPKGQARPNNSPEEGDTRVSGEVAPKKKRGRPKNVVPNPEANQSERQTSSRRLSSGTLPAASPSDSTSIAEAKGHEEHIRGRLRAEPLPESGSEAATHQGDVVEPGNETGAANGNVASPNPRAMDTEIDPPSDPQDRSQASAKKNRGRPQKRSLSEGCESANAKAATAAPEAEPTPKRRRGQSGVGQPDGSSSAVPSKSPRLVHPSVNEDAVDQESGLDRGKSTQARQPSLRPRPGLPRESDNPRVMSKRGNAEPSAKEGQDHQDDASGSGQPHADHSQDVHVENSARHSEPRSSTRNTQRLTRPNERERLAQFDVGLLQNLEADPSDHAGVSRGVGTLATVSVAGIVEDDRMRQVTDAFFSSEAAKAYAEYQTAMRDAHNAFLAKMASAYNSAVSKAQAVLGATDAIHNTVAQADRVQGQDTGRSTGTVSEGVQNLDLSRQASVAEANACVGEHEAGETAAEPSSGKPRGISESESEYPSRAFGVPLSRTPDSVRRSARQPGSDKSPGSRVKIHRRRYRSPEIVDEEAAVDRETDGQPNTDDGDPIQDPHFSDVESRSRQSSAAVQQRASGKKRQSKSSEKATLPAQASHTSQHGSRVRGGTSKDAGGDAPAPNGAMGDPDADPTQSGEASNSEQPVKRTRARRAIGDTTKLILHALSESTEPLTINEIAPLVQADRAIVVRGIRLLETQNRVGRTGTRSKSILYAKIPD